eukprot:COSAG01_NODE_281_length_19504_cov_129.173124_31_plen_49_part_00
MGASVVKKTMGVDAPVVFTLTHISVCVCVCAPTTAKALTIHLDLPDDC